MPVAFGTLARGDVVACWGYRFRIYLPSEGGVGVHEVPGSAVADGETIDPRLAESIWCAYAWPETYGVTGEFTYFVNQEGVVLSANVTRYAGTRVPPAGAAFAAGGLDSIDRRTAAETVGQDGNVWRRVE